jgi:hypothetical protein
MKTSKPDLPPSCSEPASIRRLSLDRWNHWHAPCSMRVQPTEQRSIWQGSTKYEGHHEKECSGTDVGGLDLVAGPDGGGSSTAGHIPTDQVGMDLSGDGKTGRDGAGTRWQGTLHEESRGQLPGEGTELPLFFPGRQAGYGCGCNGRFTGDSEPVGNHTGLV